MILDDYFLVVLWISLGALMFASVEDSGNGHVVSVLFERYWIRLNFVNALVAFFLL